MEFTDTKDKTAGFDSVEIYSGIFSFLILAILLSFIFVPGITPSTLSTDFRWRKSLINVYASFRFKVGYRF